MSIIVNNLRQLTIAQLETANKDLRLGRNLKSTYNYKQVLKKDILALFHDPKHDYGWSIVADNTISFNNALLLLSDYFSQTTESYYWNRAVNILVKHPEFSTLDINDRVHIDIISIHRNILHQINIEKTLKQLQDYLTLPKINKFTLGLIHHTISRLAVLIRNEELALVHCNAAKHLISFEDEPYYHLLNHEQLGTIYYMLNNDRQYYYEKGIQIYHETEHQARMLDNGHDFTYAGYNLGWAYVELDLYEEATYHFKRAMLEADSTQNAVMVAKCEYGLGYVYSCLKDYDKSIEYLTNALMYFCDKSYVYSAACLNLLASTLLSLGHIDNAIQRLDYAIDNLLKVDNPVQLHHVYRQYSKAYRMNSNWIRALQYVVKTYQIRIKYKMPLFPY